MKEVVDSIFISDIHLGSKFCKANKLNSFLSKYSASNLYLIGDIFDGWKMKRKIYWTEDMSCVVSTVLKMIDGGTKVVYISGNHDEFLRRFNIPLKDVIFCDEYIHSYKGGNILLTHGDVFDNLCNKYNCLYHIGDILYTASLYLNGVSNLFFKLFKMKERAISSIFKKKIKKAVNFINDFEIAASAYCLKNDCDQIMVGHIHHPELNKEMNGVIYHNTGDWVESCSAIIEKEGKLELVFA